MRSRLSLFADPMIAVLALATLLAILVPSIGDGRAIAQIVANLAIFVLFLVNGMRVPRGDIAKGAVNWRFFLPLLVWVYGAMALIGLAFASVTGNLLPPLVALGFLFLGVLPSTIQSATSYTGIAGGNIALSVVGAALVNIVGVFLSAPLFAVLGGGEVANLGTDALVRIGTILVLPFLVGQAFQGWTTEWLQQRKDRVVWLDRIVIGIAVYVAFSGAVEQGLLGMFDGGDWAVLLAATIAFLALANIGVWLLAGIMAYPRADRIAFLFAGAQKSVAIGAPLAAILFAPSVAGFVIAPLLLYHLLQLVLAAPLATHLARHPG